MCQVTQRLVILTASVFEISCKNQTDKQTQHHNENHAHATTLGVGDESR